MPTLFHVGAYRVMIRTNDHTPAHVHATGPDGEAKLELGATAADITIVYNHGVTKRDLVAVIAAVEERHQECRRSWRAIHGR